MSCAYHYDCGGHCDTYEAERREHLAAAALARQARMQKSMTLIDPKEKADYEAEMASRKMGVEASEFRVPVPKPGYHLHEIPKGELGELSKVQEELDELRDAELQGIKVMQLVEASDLIGALVRWLERHHPGTTLDDLISMHRVTRRAFDNGRRK